MTEKWPFVGDGAAARARQVAQKYREALLAADPQRCAELDHAARQVGEGWMLPARFADDDFVSPTDAAEQVGCSVRAVYKWVAEGDLANYPEGGKVRVRLGDARRVDADRRARAR